MKETKRTKKRILGLLGLVLVIVATIFAAFLPEPEASAIDGAYSSMDTILVRVVGDVPNVQFTSPENDSIFITPNQTLSLNYENVSTATVQVTYKDKSDMTYSCMIDMAYVDYKPGSLSYDLNLFEPDLGQSCEGGPYINGGYGEYLVDVSGEGYGVDNVAQDLVKFYFYPVYGEAEEDESDGLIYLDLHYDTQSDNIANIKINIYDEDGNLVSEMSQIGVTPPNTRAELPFSEKGMPTGNYKIEIIAYGEDGEALYKPYYTNVYYEAIPAPDTGAFFRNLGISKADYIITALAIFLIVAVLGIVFVAKGRKENSKK